jgi:predicted nucleic acid-binding protein
MSGHYGIEGRITKVYIGKLARNRAFFEEEVENTYSTETLDELNKAKAY